ncbi:MAG: phosphoribosylformylglycinamidine synthase subunit PurS [Acidilobaceae archaeon]
MKFYVEAIVTYKKELRDPEGETILEHLVKKRGYSSVSQIRTGKYYLMVVEASSPQEAIVLVKEMCDKLRIYNPIVNDLEVRVRE